MTITEKILARHAGKSHVRAGDNIWIEVDVLMTHDVCGPPTIGIFRKQFGRNAKVWDPKKVVIIPDHYIFTSDTHAQRNIQVLREFAKEQHLPHFYDPGTETYKGVCHVSLAEEGFNLPGTVLFGTDSHTCTSGAFGMFGTGIGNTDAAFVMGTGKLWVKVPETMKFVIEGELPNYLMAKDIILKIISDIGVDGATYKSMDFDGEGVFSLSMEERMTLCNMVIEAGGKNGVIQADDKTEAFVRSRTDRSYEIYQNDADAAYASIHIYQASKLEPMVAKPFLPSNGVPAHTLSHVKVNQCYIGSCTGGKITDFIAAAQILHGQEVQVTTVIVPATVEVNAKFDQEKVDGKTLRDIFTEAGAVIGDPSCAACLGGPQDTFGRLNHDEICISTTNRNFPGRMGSKNSQTYLASPYTVAASALTGTITDPREYLNTSSSSE
ncbi:3-isopropylmalate dehydratase large subunit [bacterium]|nr:3-isopropylmalate dehydratase large subunit [bacterium]